MHDENLYTFIILVVFSLALVACSPAAPAAPAEEPTAVPTTLKPTSTTSRAQELKVQADDVTLHVRIAGDPEVDDVLLAVNMAPGFSSHYMASLEQVVD